MKAVLVLAAITGIALGCATPRPQQQVLASADGSVVSPVAAEEFKPRSHRIGFWEIDLVAIDYEPRGTTFRLFDFKIFRLLEVGQGADYQAFSFAEMPGLLSPFTMRHEDASDELRVFDVQAVELALVRQTSESATESEAHYFKVPVLGSLFSVEGDETQPELEHQSYFFVLRRDVEHSHPAPPQVAAPGP
jgi:hypothetical protein